MMESKINAYFKSGGKLYCVTVWTDDVVVAQRQAARFAADEKLSLESPILAVVQSKSAGTVPVLVAA